MNARPLHRQAMLGRNMPITEQVDLHMVGQESRIFLKSMPDRLLRVESWERYICKDRGLCDYACGLLLSYTWLVSSKRDLRITQREGPPACEITWDGWRIFTKALLSSINFSSLDDVNKRYHYGELRLSRLNLIYRLFTNKLSLTTFVRGYIYGYNQYSDIVQRNFAWALVSLFTSRLF